jgi:hypothetical protein
MTGREAEREGWEKKEGAGGRGSEWGWKEGGWEGGMFQPPKLVSRQMPMVFAP